MIKIISSNNCILSPYSIENVSYIFTRNIHFYKKAYINIYNENDMFIGF